MKPNTLFLITLLSLVLFTCKNTSNTEIEASKPVLNEEIDALDAIEAEQEKDLANAYFYVLAPNGLSLRKEDHLKSEKLLTIPFGAKVRQTAPMFTVDLTVENIEGSMIEVLYDDKAGYAFSGFLNKFPPRQADETIENYVARLKAIDVDVQFTSKATEPDFHEGIVETIILPKIAWFEAFYLAKTAYNIPNSFSYPGENGPNKETIVQKDKEDYVWSSEINVTRDANTLERIQYNWRAEGGGYAVIITYLVNAMQIEYTGFAD